MLRIFESASAAERLECSRRFVTNLAPGRETVIASGTRAAADDFVRALAVERVATFGLHRFSFVQFAVQIARDQLAQRGLAPLTAAGASAIAVRSVFEVRKRNGLKFLESVAQKPGFATALANTVRDLRASSVEPDVLLKLGERGTDLAVLLAEYRAQLTSAKLVDISDVFSIAAERVRTETVGLSSLPIVLLDTPIASGAERRFVEALAGKAPEVLATVASGDNQTLAALADMGGERSTEARRTSTSLNRLQNFVFGSTPESSYPEDGMVRFFSAPGEGRECVEIARRIHEAAREGIPFDKVAVVLRSPQTYAPLLESALERAGIPGYFARGTRRPDASGRALLTLLLCAEERLSAKRFAEYLSLAQVPNLEENGASQSGVEPWTAPNDDMLPESNATADEQPPPEPLPDRVDEQDPLVAGTLRAPWRWEELLVEAAVIGGKDRWARRLNGLASELARKVKALRFAEPDSVKISRLERQLTNLGHLSRFALPILSDLAEFPEHATWGEWLVSLERLASKVLRRPENVLAALAELQIIADVGPVTLTEVLEALSTRLTELSVEPTRSRYGKVFIGSPEQLRGRSFEIVFVPGLAERVFPQKLREDPLLLDGDRTHLSVEPPLRTLRDRANDERLRLRMAVGAARQRFYFSYPRVEVALARPRVPSFYALDIRRTTLGRLPNVDQFEQEAARNSGAELAWLAPRDPKAAIDNIEHDLSVLRPLLIGGPKLVRGSARYLMELSPELGRSLRTRWQRWQTGWGASDGICVPSKSTCGQLAPYRLTTRAFSPTSLQSFATCPYKFLLSAIHRLSPREESVPLEQLDPLTRGHMYHAVLAGFLRYAIAEKLLRLSPSNVAQAQAKIEDILKTTAAEYHEELAPAIERVWQDEIEIMRADLRGLLTQMAENPDGYVPELIEFGFGLPTDGGRDPASTAQAAKLPGGYLVHGVIDLVERNVSGQCRVTDHKTGKNRTEDGMIVGHGEVLQPVLYSLSVEASLGTEVKEARLSYCTAVGGYTERTVVMDAWARKAASEVLRTIDHAIENGFLPAAPKEHGCDWCDFVSVCGPYEELRTGRKDPNALTELVQLRGIR
jgi:ATP-dependent helicase/nuclease subunit B